MNKYEKAFDVIDTILHLMCGEEREDGYKPSQDEMVNSMEDFKELVERATPKKICHTKEEGSFTFNFGRCECGREILSANDYVKYCPCCGQALDWRD